MIDIAAGSDTRGQPPGATPQNRPQGPADAVCCIVCGGTYEPAKLPGLFQCRSCGFVSADMSIPEAELEALYGRDYFHGEEYLDYAAEQDSLVLNFQRRIAVLERLAGDLSSVDLFEIGCAYGYFLRMIQPRVARAQGIDISPAAVERAVREQNVEATAGDYLSHDLGRRVDLIAMWDTIEHLKRPDLFIRKAAADLKNSGLLAITTGDIASWNARLRGKSWRMIHPPTHMHYFSVATLSQLLDREGFDVVHVSHPGNSRRLRSVLYFLTALRGRQAKFYDAVQSWRVFDLNLTVNLFDIMYVVGRKRVK